MIVTYFAYGSNMCSARLRSRVPGATSRGPAVLHDYELRFRKRSNDGSSKCDVAPAPDRTVHGVLFEIPSSEKSALDEAEGLGRGYREIQCVVAAGGGEAITAFLYVAEADAVDESLLPYAWYKRIVLAGAREHALPATYIAALDEAPCRDDADERRATRALRRAGLLA